ncbi:MAG TPA: BA14K family protein [Methylocella sp.]|nr:BA14K family protein [Methylocella sp.]
MTSSLKILAATSALAAALAGQPGSASALPAIDRLEMRNESPGMIQSVGWGWGWGWGWGPALAGGVLAGALVGSALAAPYYYGPYYYPYARPYYPAPAGYYAPGYYGPPAGGSAVNYCIHRFRSYDPRTGTYLGSDGHRHPCP